jgi:tetratricopeptide (TPR) repeat protein
VKLADRAESVDPLLVEPLWAKALAADARGQSQGAFDLYVRAVHRQPKNPQTWRLAGLYAYQQRCYRLAYEYLERFTELDKQAKPSQGGSQYNRALRIVDSGRAKC